MKKENEKYYHPDNIPNEDEMIIIYDGYGEIEGRYSFGEYRKGIDRTIISNVNGWRLIDGSHPKCPICKDAGTIIFNSPIFGYEREIACEEC
jgi:hypothetical protein